MRNPLPVLVALFVALAAAFAVAIGVMLLSSGSGSLSGRQVGVVLIYEVDPQFTPDLDRVDMQRLVDSIDARLYLRRYKAARVRQLDDGRIEIGLFGNDPDTVRRIERMLKRAGTLEFRILANQRDHKSLIERARRQDDDVLKTAQGAVVAWWVPLEEGDGPENKQRIDGILSDPEIATRTSKQDDREIREVLVVKDSFDVGGSYLADAARARDGTGNPCVAFRFNAAGARLFGRLTTQNLPNKVQDFYRKLGIILDGRLHSAPRIVTTIRSRGVITGSFTEEEADDLATLLNAGSLPAAVRQVEKRVIDSEH